MSTFALFVLCFDIGFRMKFSLFLVKKQVYCLYKWITFSFQRFTKDSNMIDDYDGWLETEDIAGG